MPILLFTAGASEPSPPPEVIGIPDLTDAGIAIRQFDGNDIEYTIENEIIESDQVEQSTKASVITVDGNEHSWTEFLDTDILTKSVPRQLYVDKPQLTTQADVTNYAIQEAFVGKQANSPGGLCVYRPYFNKMDKVRWIDPSLGANYEGRISSMQIEMDQGIEPFQRVTMGIEPLLICVEPGAETLEAEDNFIRAAESSSWGTSTYGGDWTETAAVGVAAFNTTGKAATLENDGSNFGILTSVSGTGFESKVIIAAPGNKTKKQYEQGYDWGLVMRYASTTSWHAALLRFTSRGQARVILMSWDTSDGKNVWKSYTLPFSFWAGKEYHLKAIITGTSPTVLRAKAWPVGGLEPSNYQAGAACWEADGTNRGPQTAGNVGLMSIRYDGATDGNFIASFKDFRVIS